MRSSLVVRVTAIAWLVQQDHVGLVSAWSSEEGEGPNGGNGFVGDGQRSLRKSKKGHTGGEGESFSLTSSAVTENGVLAAEYTCWGNGGVKTGATIPLSWSNPPSGTQSFMLTLTTPQDGWTCARYDWVLHSIGEDVTSISAGNADNVGVLGQTWPNGKGGNYVAKVPCPKVDDPSDAPETFEYTYTLYALSTDGTTLTTLLDDGGYADLGPELVIEATQSNVVLGTAVLTASYTCESADACPATSTEIEERRLRLLKKTKKGGGGGGPVTNTNDDGECISLNKRL